MAGSKRSAEKEKFWRAVVEEQGQGELSVREFCRQQSLSEASFYAWRKELRKRDDQKGLRSKRDAVASRSECRLLPVDVLPPQGEAGTADGGSGLVPLEIETPGGFTLRFGSDTPPQKIGQLLEVLGHAAVTCGVSPGAASC